MVHHFRGKLIARGDANRGGRSRSISKSKRCCCCTTFVPVASSLCTDFWDGMITLYMLVAACLHAPIYPSMDAGLIVNINYEVLDVYRARPTVIFGSVMWNITGEKGFLSFSLPSSLPPSLSLFFSSPAWKFHKVSEFISTGVTFDKFSNRCAPPCENLYASPHKINRTLDN